MNDNNSFVTIFCVGGIVHWSLPVAFGVIRSKIKIIASSLICFSTSMREANESQSNLQKQGLKRTFTCLKIEFGYIIYILIFALQKTT
jgi:hypothetical protein